MNFNFSKKPDYDLNTGLIDELIRLYGTTVKFVFTDKIQDYRDVENSIFNDFKTIKTQRGVGESIEQEIQILLSETSEYPNGLNFHFSNFGLVNEDTIQAFVSLKSLDFLRVEGNIHPREIISNFMVFPNGKVMEITDCQVHVPGVNNKFIYSDTPSCYMLSMKSHSFDKAATSIIKNGGSVKASESKVEEFFTREDDLIEDIKEFVTGDQLGTRCNKDVIINNQVDDVFGSS